MSEADGNTGELRDIAYHVECLVAAVERIEKALAPQGSERERIALQFCLLSTGTCTSEWSFSMADHWIAERDLQRSIQAMREAERDKQRAQQAKCQQGGQTSEQ